MASKRIAYEKDIEIWMYRLQLLENETRAQKENYEELHKNNEKQIQKLKKEIRDLHQRKKLFNTLGCEKCVKGDYSAISNGKINALNIQENMEYMKQKLFEQTKQLDLLRYQYQKKQLILDSKKNQCKELLKSVRKKKRGKNSNFHNSKKTIKLENQCLLKKMRIEEAKFINQKYEEIKNILLQEQKNYEKQLNDLIENMKFYEIQKESTELMNETAKLLKALQLEEFDKIKSKFNKIEYKQKKKISKFQRQLSKLKSKQNKQKQAFKTNLPMVKQDLAYKNDKTEKNSFEEILQMIKDKTGITSIKEFEERYFQQKKTREDLEKMKEELQQKLKELEKEENELEVNLEKLKLNTNHDEIEKINNLEDKKAAFLVKQQQNETEIKHINEILGNIKLSLEHILIKFENVSGQERYQILNKNVTIKELFEMCNEVVKILLENIAYYNLDDLKKAIEMERFQEQDRSKFVTNHEMKKEKSLNKNLSFNEDDENLDEKRMLMKEAAKKYVEAQTQNKDQRRQIIRL